MLALVTALSQHDRHTRGHSERVRLFCDLLARELGLSQADAGRLRWAALIHDIGKLEVSAAVLNKAGRLDAGEWSQVRMHPEAGARLARPLAAWLGPWYADIVEHVRIVTTYDMWLDGVHMSTSVASFEFEPVAEGTRFTHTEHGVFFDRFHADGPGREEGSRGLLDLLAAHLARD